MSDAQRRRWEDHTEDPLVIGAVAYLGAYAWPILNPDLPSWAAAFCGAVMVAVWVAFVLDFVLRILLADRRGRFLATNWIDAVTLVVPMLRPLRVMVAINILGRRGGAFIRGRVVASVIAAIVLVGFVASLAVLAAERGRPEASINTFGDACWWAISTVTTVGYGDRYPITVAGRVIATGLMVTGIALLGVITASLASWFVENISEDKDVEPISEDQWGRLTDEIRQLRSEVAQLRSGHNESSP